MVAAVSCLRVLAMLFVLAVLPGCDDEVAPVEPPEPPRGFFHPDDVISALKLCYTDKDFSVYRDLVLDDEFTFVLQQSTVDEFDLEDDVFDRTEDLSAVKHMFSGASNLDGEVIRSFEFQVLQPLGAWLPVAVDDPDFGDVPGARARLYSVLFYSNTQSDFRYETHGEQIFVVTADTFMVDGVPSPRYRLRGQIDLTTVLSTTLATPAVTWGTLKALFL